VVAVTHELASIFTIADNSVYLDAQTRTMLAQGDPKKLLAESKDPKVHAFLTRGGQEAGAVPTGRRAGAKA
jgi:phospholipid/cholesterol/gamma-HCH transport system ATP-binding protein